MNITLNGTKITQDSKTLAFEKNNNVDEIVITVDTDESWSYKLDVKYPDKFNIGKDALYNIIDLGRNGNICSVILTREMLPFNGKYTMQLRGINGDKVYHSDTFEVWVKYSIEPGSTYNPVPSEFYQVEARLDNKVDEAKQYAENAEIASTRMPKISSDNTWLIWDAETGDYVDTGIMASGDSVTVDGELSDTSENPVQNRVVKSALDSLSEEKADKEYISLKKYGITAVDYEAPFTTEMYEVAYANGKGFQKAIDDAKANGRKAIVIPNGNYPLCWAGGESEANPIIVSEGVDIYGNDSRLYVIFDEDGINPYFTGDKPYTLSGTVIATDSSIYDLNIEGERQYRVTSPGWQDNSCGIGLTGNSHNNVIQNCTIKHISGDGIGCRNLGVQLATWTDTFAALGWNGSTYVASTKMYRSTRHGVGFIADMSAPHLINSIPNFMWSTEPFVIRCFDGEADDDLGNMLGVVRVHGMQYFYFPEGTKSWYIELTREAEHAEDATESWQYFLRQAYYSGTQIIGCELCYNQRGGMSNLPDSAVIRNCRVHNNGNAVNGMVAYYDATRFGLDQEEVVIGSLTIEDSLFYGTNAGVYYKSWSIVLKNSKFYGDIAGVRSLNGAVDFMAINCDFVSDHPIYGGACILTGAAEFGEKTMIGCRVVGRISDSITVFGGDMSKAKPVYADSDGNYVASTDYVWIGNDGKMLPSGGGINITGATVGQIARISEVDENGTPTVWEPVDLPTGGASSTEEWVQIADYTWTAEDAAQTSTIYFKYDNDINGDPLSIDAIWIIYSVLTEANRMLYFKLGTDNFNKNYIGAIGNALKNNQTLYVYAEMFPNPKHAIIDYSLESTMLGGADVTRKLWVPEYDSSFVFPATGLTIFSSGALLEGSNFKVFGRKKIV